MEFAEGNLIVCNLPGEVRAILEDKGRVGLGSLLAQAGRQAALTEEEWAVFISRDKAPGRPVSLE